jgi:hypothetical protein
MRGISPRNEEDRNFRKEDEWNSFPEIPAFLIFASISS